MELNKINEKIIGCGIEVHKKLGAGLLQSIYESALCIELSLNYSQTLIKNMMNNAG
ncbi:hypothetical protein B6I21_00650 [candidate division KSB1 bacterium 4572_119]|nr:MAG: hypothetical protein B6I21_00650 [candidate division KSB1 bacterium 4572_119]